jgi:small conductance mechanosensitive channel
MIESLGRHIPELIRTAVVVVVVVTVYLVTARVARRFIQRIERRGAEDGSRATTLWAMLRRLITIAAVLVTALTVANVWGISIAPFLAVGSAIGVALGFGAQGLVRDVIAGFFILAEDQYRIGDVIEIAGVGGVVEDIRPRVTVLRDVEGSVHYVNNGRIEVATNFTQEYGQAVVDVAVAYSEDIEQVIPIIGEVLAGLASEPAWKPVLLGDPEVLGVERLGDSGVVIRAVLKVKADARWSVRREALRRIKNRLDAEGIVIPVSHRLEG